MSFLRHAEIYRSDVICKTFESWGRGTASRWSAPGPAKRRDGRTAPCSSSAMSFRAGYSLAGCSPAEPASASPTALSMRWGMSAGNYMPANGNLSLVSVSQHKGAVQSPITHFLNRVPKIAPSRFEVIGAARIAAFLLNLRMSSEAAFRRGARFLRSHSPGDVFLYVCPSHIQSQFQGTDRGKIAQ